MYAQVLQLPASEFLVASMQLWKKHEHWVVQNTSAFWSQRNREPSVYFLDMLDLFREEQTLEGQEVCLRIETNLSHLSHFGSIRNEQSGYFVPQVINLYCSKEIIGCACFCRCCKHWKKRITLLTLSPYKLFIRYGACVIWTKLLTSISTYSVNFMKWMKCFKS